MMYIALLAVGLAQLALPCRIALVIHIEDPQKGGNTQWLAVSMFRGLCWHNFLGLALFADDTVQPVQHQSQQLFA
jgi:hypothetical protein